MYGANLSLNSLMKEESIPVRPTVEYSPSLNGYPCWTWKTFTTDFVDEIPAIAMRATPLTGSNAGMKLVPSHVVVT
jgi:hypothetical protein